MQKEESSACFPILHSHSAFWISVAVYASPREPPPPKTLAASASSPPPCAGRC